MRQTWGESGRWPKIEGFFSFLTRFCYFCVDERLPEHIARGGRRGGADAGRGRMRPWRHDRAGRAAHDVEVI